MDNVKLLGCIAVLVLMISLGVHSEECTKDNIQRCIGEQPLQGLSDDAAIAGAVQELCGNVQETLMCLSGILPSCDVKLAFAIGEMMKHSEWLCSEDNRAAFSRLLFKTSSTCAGKADSVECAADLPDFETLDEENPPDDICKPFETAYTCVDERLSRKCSDDIEDFVSELLRRVSTDIPFLTDCEWKRSDTSSASFITWEAFKFIAFLRTVYIVFSGVFGSKPFFF